MTKRQELNEKIDAKSEARELLRLEIIELKKQALLLSDDVQQFEEKKEIIGRGKHKREVLVGRIHWKEDFKDEDTGEVVTIERQQAVRIDGEWQ
jgi:FtsZ-binding cell division protein ZapB